MNRKYLSIVVLVLLMGGIVYLGIGDSLQTQVINESDNNSESQTVKKSECSLLSENSANNCYLKLAVSKGSAMLCENITKSSEKKKCQREVELGLSL